MFTWHLILLIYLHDAQQENFKCTHRLAFSGEVNLEDDHANPINLWCVSTNIRIIVGVDVKHIDVT